MSQGLTEQPDRGQAESDLLVLLELDKDQSAPKDLPSTLSFEDIHVATSLFQPRGTSLTLAPRNSNSHVETMKRVVGQGNKLDPLTVISFGSHWYLIDGHHRLEAYRKAEALTHIPVSAHDCDLRGRERVEYANRLSTELNSKNKLAMSEWDKLDSAWRLVVSTGLSMSKAQVARTTGVSSSTVSSMRRILTKLHESNRFVDEPIGAWSWRRARFEEEKLEGAVDANYEYDNRELRVLTKKLAVAVDSRTPAHLILEALESLLPGVTNEFKDLIADRDRLAKLDLPDI